jgi:hypothetical protein
VPKRGEGAAGGEGGDRRPPHRQPGLQRRFRVGPDGVDDAPGAQAPEQQLQDHDDDDRHHEHRAELVVADAEHGRAGEVDEPLR